MGATGKSIASAGAVKFCPVMRMSYERHIALEAERIRDESRIVAIGPEGLEVLKVDTEDLGLAYPSICAEPITKSIFGLLRVNSRAFINNGDAIAPLLEAFFMADTGTTEPVKELSLSALTASYNKLAEGIGKAPIKSFKSKGEAQKRIDALSAELKAPTAVQAENKATKQEAAAKRLSGLEPLKEKKKEEAQAKRDAKAAEKSRKSTGNSATSTTSKTDKEPTVATTKSKIKKTANAAKKAAPAKKDSAKKAAPAKKAAASKESKPRGLGIGAFCMDLINKGKTNPEIADAAQKKFGSATSTSSVAWYRNKMKAEGLLK